MSHPILSPKPIYYETALASIRIFVGLMMAYHGWEVFSPETIAGYAEWEQIKVLPAPLVMAYLGKGLELVTGICFTLGLFTRVAAVLMAINMLVICFYIGNGRFYYEDQHPFLFALLAVVFFFTGPIKWSLDQKLFK